MPNKIYVQSSLENFIRSASDNLFGIIVGQIYDDNVYITHLASTKTLSNLKTLIDDKTSLWSHGREVSMMLPGGIDVLGIYIATDNEINNEQYNKVLIDLEKNIVNFQILPHSNYSKYKLLLQISKNADLKFYICDSNSPISKPLKSLKEWQYINFTQHWLCLETYLVLNSSLLQSCQLTQSITPNKRIDQSYYLRKRFKNGLIPILQSYFGQAINFSENANNIFSEASKNIYMINGRILDANDANTKICKYICSDSQKHGEKLPYLSVDIIHEQSDTGEKDNNYAENLPADLFFLNGTLVSRAFVPNECQTAIALQMLIKDVIRSLSARCEIIVDEEDTYEHELESKTFFETPSRVFFPMGETNLSISDYIFRGEESSDCLKPINDILGLNQLDPGQIESDVERFSDPSELSTPVPSTLSLNSQQMPIMNNFASIFTRRPNLNGVALLLPFGMLLVGYIWKKWSSTINMM